MHKHFMQAKGTTASTINFACLCGHKVDVWKIIYWRYPSFAEYLIKTPIVYKKIKLDEEDLVDIMGIQFPDAKGLKNMTWGGQTVTLEKPKPLPWAKIFHRRCGAVLERRPGSDYWGQCELSPHADYIDHALERGMETPRWSTERTDYYN